MLVIPWFAPPQHYLVKVVCYQTWYRFWYSRRRIWPEFLISPGADYLISSLGWRLACVVMGAVVTAIVLPLVVIFQRDRLEDVGLLPDGDLKPV